MSESQPELEAPTTRRHEEAITQASREARVYGVSERAFRDAVLGVRNDADVYERALHVIEARRVVRRTTPATQRPRDPQSLPSPEALNPWTDDIDALSTARATGWCPACMGSGATRCAMCRGTGRRKCPRCEGAGGGCQQCGGQRRVPCDACTNGELRCEVCSATGAVEAWLDVERTTRKVVCVHPMGAAARAHPSVTSVDDFDAPPSSWPDVLVSDSGLCPPTTLAVELMPRLDDAERTVAARVQRLKSAVHLVEYATLFGRGIIHVSGSPLTVSSVSNWRPLELRRVAVLVTAAVSFGAALLAGLTYDTRHAWYAHLRHGTLVLVIGVLLAASVTAMVSGVTLGGRARTPMRVWVPAGATMLLLGALVLVVTRDRPRALHARASLERGDVASAALEADALRSLEVDRAAGDALLDALHLRELRSVSDVDRVLVLANAPWASTDARAEARRIAAAAIERRAEALIASGDAEAMTAFVERARPFSAATSERLMRASALVKARRCAELGDGECTRARCREVLEHGGEAHETAPILRRATERVAERLRDAVARADAARTPRERVDALRDALWRSEDFTTLTREPTTPAARELRDRIARAEIEIARTNRDAGLPSRDRSRRRAETQ